MKQVDPPRLLDGPLSDFERELLSCAQRERPDHGTSAKMLGGLHLVGPAPGPATFPTGAPAGAEAGLANSGAAASAGAGAGTSLAPAATAVSATWIAKWGAGVAVVGSLVGATVWGFAPSSESGSHPDRGASPHASSQGAVPAPTETSSALVETTAAGDTTTFHDEQPSRTNGDRSVSPFIEPVAEQVRRAAPSPIRSGQASRNAVVDLAPAEPAEPADESDITAEVLALNRVRAAVRRGRATEALQLLSTYRRSFPNGSLGPEANVLESRAQKLRAKSSSASKSP